jgi:hypothetical protein
MAKTAPSAASESTHIISLFGDQEDFHEGEAEYLVAMLKKMGTTPDDMASLIRLDVNGDKYNMTGHMKTLHMLATAEEVALGKDFGEKVKKQPWMMTGLSDFGNAVPKYPRSWVEKILEMEPTKQHRYMFSGSTTGRVLKHRHWLRPFVEAHFNGDDYYRATDARKSKNYKPLGEWDRSLTDPSGFRPKDCGGECMTLDKTYWKGMVQSKFILTPGGDAPYSFRFYESFLAGAIPIIDSIENDWLPRASTKWVSMIKYDFKMASDFPHSFDEATAKRNQKKFIRYQTFLEGDNDPIKDQKDGTYEKLFGEAA